MMQLQTSVWSAKENISIRKKLFNDTKIIKKMLPLSRAYIPRLRARGTVQINRVKHYRFYYLLILFI